MNINPNFGNMPMGNLCLGSSFGTLPASSSPISSQYCAMTRLPILATLNLLNLSKLTNDPFLHHSSWTSILVKLPSDISKFEGKSGEDPSNHVMTFHLWCSSNLLTDDS